MKKTIHEDLEIIKRGLDINSDSNPTNILWDILRMDTIGTDNRIYFEHIYIKNPYITEKAELFLKSLEYGTCPFSLIHGYSKNGKTTFLQYIRYLNNQKEDENKSRLLIIPFNFERDTAKDYIDKIRLFWKDEFRFHNRYIVDDLCDFIDFYNFYNDFILNLKHEIDNSDEESDNRTNELLSYFENFCEREMYNLSHFMQNKKEHINDYNNLKSLKIEFQDYLDEHINYNNVGDLFSLLILFKLFKKRYSLFYKKNKKHKIIFLLDNMDDYLKNNDLLFLQYPQVRLSVFIYHLTQKPIIGRIFNTCLKEYIEIGSHDTISDWSFSFRNNFNVCYAFRSANFLAFSNLIKEAKKDISVSQEKYYPQCMIDVNYYRINSTSFTSEILDRRMKFAEVLFSELKISELPQGFQSLKILATIDSSMDKVDYSQDEIIDAKSIFSLWNGDKKAFFESLISHWVKVSEEFYSYEESIINCSKHNFVDSQYLLKGVYIYLFLFLLDKTSDFNNFLKIIYIYRKTHRTAKSITRFMLNYIINKSEQNIKPRSIDEIESKGAGLLDLLKKINDYVYLINTTNSAEIYSFENIESFFKDSYSDKIDFFAHLFTIYKTQIINNNGQEANSILYNLDKELEEFQNYDNHTNLCHLNEIRIFNNHNSAFLSNYLISHFELSSFCLSHDETEMILSIQKPLLFSIEKKGKVKEIKKASDFELYDIIEKVYENTELTITTIVNFYIKNLIIQYPPHKFLKDELLTLTNKDSQLGDFQFRLIVHRHISYLESFRHGIVTDSIASLDIDKKKIVNEYITKIILKYIKLYETNFYNIKNALDKNIYNPPTILDTSYDILVNKYRPLAKKVLSDNENGLFNTVITKINS